MIVLICSFDYVQVGCKEDIQQVMIVFVSSLSNLCCVGQYLVMWI
jgi:hypothetical protein